MGKSAEAVMNVKSTEKGRRSGSSASKELDPGRNALRISIVVSILLKKYYGKTKDMEENARA